MIATPNDVHMELALACEACGKHVISEKPVALSVAQLDEMIAVRSGTVSYLPSIRIAAGTRIIARSRTS